MIPNGLSVQAFARVCSHEAGHVIVTWVSPIAAWVSYASVGEDGGETCQQVLTVKLLKPRILWESAVSALAGIAAEAVTMDSMAMSQCKKDMNRAIDALTQLLALPTAVNGCPWTESEMSEFVGGSPGPFETDDPRLGQALNQCLRRAIHVVQSFQKQHLQVSRHLIRHWHISGDQIAAIMGMEPVLVHLRQDDAVYDVEDD